MTSYTFYFAGELFSQKHLIGNALLADSILEASKEKFVPILPQDLEFRSVHPKAIRDQDILSLLQCDLALFNFDGPELDSGTVVEFMFAKFADIPSVILRTDFREGGDQDGGGDPWNLMCSFYPRTKTVLYPCLESSVAAGHKRSSRFSAETAKANLQAQKAAISLTAKKVIEGFESVLTEPPVLTQPTAETVYQYLQKMPNFDSSEEEVNELLQNALEKKQKKGLL